VVGDDAINRCIVALRNLARSHTPEPFRIETVRGVGYSLIATSPDGAPSPAPDPATPAPTPRRLWARRRLAPAAFAAIGVLLLAAAAGWAAWTWLRPAEPPLPKIALSPFTPLDPDVEAGAFARRLTNDVDGVLNENIAGLAPPEPDGSTARADLRVGGSVQRDGGILRVRAYLEDGRARVTLWSRQYERLAAQEEELRTQVAADVSDNLLTAMEPLQQKGLKMDPRAVALWLSATAIHRQGRTMGDPLVAARAFEEVVERAPEFARARGMLAQSLANASAFSPGPPKELAALKRRARAEAEHAIRSDPTTAEAGYDALYWLARDENPADLAKAEDIWNWGVSRASKVPGGLMRRCELRLDVGRVQDALSDCQRAAALRPLGAPWGYRYARALAAAGRVEEADRAFAREVHLHPQHWWIRQARFDMLAFSRPPAEALAFLHAPADPPPFRAEEVDALEAFLKARASGAPRDVDQAVAKLRTTFEHGGLGKARVFKALVVLGRVDEAFAFAPGPRDLGQAQGWLFEAGMGGLHRDPRFWRLAGQAGLIRYWRARGVWPDFCREPGLPFDCATEAARAVAKDPGPK
jgi:TolB-like protein